MIAKWFANMPVNAKLRLAFGAIFIVLAALVLSSFSGLSRVRDNGSEIYTNYVTSIANLWTVNKSLAAIYLAQKSHIIAPSEEAMDALEARVASEANSLGKALSRFRETLDAGEETEIFNEFKVLVQELLTINRGILSKSRSNNDVEANEISVSQFDPRYDKASQLVAAMLDTNIDGAAEAEAANGESFSFTLAILAGLVVVAVLVTGGLSWLVNLAVSKPLQQMSSIMLRLAEGDNEVEIHLSEREDEVGRMASAARTFKDNAVERARLEAEQQEQRERREARTRRIEDL